MKGIACPLDPRPKSKESHAKRHLRLICVKVSKLLSWLPFLK